jgi:hypothetical protein
VLTGAVIGVVVALVLTVMNRSRAKQGSGLPGRIEQALRGRGAMTLKEISLLVGKDSFMGRGQVAQALSALHGVGKLRMHPAPDGTPQLKKVDFIKYELIERAPPT